ncbi:MAG: 4-hydroxy-tetrahydrodipicolinate reductase [Bacillota bacterium]|jgi:4-hydroxy-tetrahydrodipicolinate reductase|nr:4-hydroxy-tetrahydrodipicolinate reductase [Bacillota bacterium]
MKVLLHGCNGKMGRVMTRVLSETPDMEIVAGVDLEPEKARNTYPVYVRLLDVKEDANVLIDFSHHSCIAGLLEFGTSRNVPLVICTTGFSAEEKQAMASAAGTVPILNSANMSLGVNLLLSLVSQAAALLHDGFDIEVVERHHNQKVDSPSGTALMIADAMNSALDNTMEYVYGRHSKNQRRQKPEIGIHAVRGGAIVGQHDVIFAGQGEVIEISHSALSRDVFAYGAVRATRFLVGRPPGLYSMKDVIESAG